MTESNPDHLVILAEGFYPQTGGGAQSQWEIAKAAAKEGYHVSVFTPKLSDTSKFEIVDGVDIHRPFPGAPDANNLNSKVGIVRRLLFDMVLLPYLIVWFQKYRPDVVYSASHLLHPVGKILSIIYSIPMINFVAYSPILRDSEIKRYDFRRVFETINFRFFMGDVVFSRTPRVTEVLEEHSNCQVQQAYGVLDVKDIQEKKKQIDRGTVVEPFNIPPNAIILCWVGRFVPVKRPRLALEIIEQLPAEYHLLMVGDGPLFKDIKKSVSEQIKNRIHFTGLIPHKEALDVIAISDGLLLTSETEAYPTVVFEALALKTPVYTTPVGVLSSISENRLNVTQPQDLSSLIEKRHDDSKSGIDLDVLERHSISRFASDVISQVNDLISES